MQKKNIPVLALVGFVVDGALEVPWWKDHICIKNKHNFYFARHSWRKIKKAYILFSSTDKEKKMAINGNSMTMKSLIEVYLCRKEIAFEVKIRKQILSKYTSFSTSWFCSGWGTWSTLMKGPHKLCIKNKHNFYFARHSWRKIKKAYILFLSTDKEKKMAKLQNSRKEQGNIRFLLKFYDNLSVISRWYIMKQFSYQKKYCVFSGNHCISAFNYCSIKWYHWISLYCNYSNACVCSGNYCIFAFNYRSTKYHWISVYGWFSRDIIAAMLVDENKRFLISSFCSSSSNCTLEHCYLFP